MTEFDELTDEEREIALRELIDSAFLTPKWWVWLDRGSIAFAVVMFVALAVVMLSNLR